MIFFSNVASRVRNVIAAAGILLAPVAFAQNAPTIVIGPTWVQKSFCSVMNWMFFGLTVLCTIMILWAAYMYVTAGDDTEKVHKAGQTLTYAAIGIVVALIAKGFPQLIASLFGWSAGTGGC